MSNGFFKIYGGITLFPRSTDPTNPVEGDVQFSDGSVREQGLWTYSNSLWARVSPLLDPFLIKSANYSVLSGDNDKTILVNTNSSSINITLPSPVLGFKITVKDSTGNAFSNNIVVSPNATEKIDGVTGTDVLTTANISTTYESDGTDWFRTFIFNGDSITPGLTRGIFAGGVTNPASQATASNVIDYIDITSTGNATDFGDLTVARNGFAGCGSSTRGLFGGGNSSGGATQNVIDYITIATTGNATDFGDLTASRKQLAACSSATRGLFSGGSTGSDSNIIDYVTIDSTANATDFGDLSVTRRIHAGCASPTRGLFGGGFTGANSNVIDYVTIASTGNATDFGNLTVARRGLASCSSSVRGLFSGGTSDLITIDYVTIASTGNATDFGDLSANTNNLAGTASSIRGIFAGGDNDAGTSTNVIEYVTIASTSNATDFGDLTLARSGIAATSSSHGGV